MPTDKLPVDLRPVGNLTESNVYSKAETTTGPITGKLQIRRAIGNLAHVGMLFLVDQKTGVAVPLHHVTRLIP